MMVFYFKRICNLLAGIMFCTTVQAAAPAEKLETEPTEAPAAAAAPAPAERFPLLPPGSIAAPPLVPLRGIYFEPQEANNIRDVRGVPPIIVLFRAAYHGDPELARWALARGARVNQAYDRKTALYTLVEHFAIVTEHVEATHHQLLMTAEVLLLAGACTKHSLLVHTTNNARIITTGTIN
jgi:hypothetical protein